MRARIEWGEMLAARGELEAAATQFAQVTATDPASARAWLGLAEVRMRLSESEAAREALARFLELYPHEDARRRQAEARLQQLGGAP